MPTPGESVGVTGACHRRAIVPVLATLTKEASMVIEVLDVVEVLPTCH